MSSSALQGLFYLAIAFIIYFLPSVVAEKRKHASTGGIVILNLLLGWTVLGWIIALVWACSGLPPHASKDIDDDERNCPYCAESIKRLAIVCKHCGRDVTPVPSV
jgi:hypothetical protein